MIFTHVHAVLLSTIHSARERDTMLEEEESAHTSNSNFYTLYLNHLCVICNLTIFSRVKDFRCSETKSKSAVKLHTLCGPVSAHNFRSGGFGCRGRVG